MKGKKAPLRIFVCEKLLSVNNQKAENSNRQKSFKKSRESSPAIMSWITCCIDRMDGEKNNYGFFISLCQLAVVLQPLCFSASVVKTPLKQSEALRVNGRMNGPL